MRSLLSVLFASTILMGTSALAADLDPPIIENDADLIDFYIAVRGGVAMTKNTTFGLTTPAGPFTNVINDYKNLNFDVSGAAGISYDYGSIRARFDLEGGFNRAKISGHTLQALGANFTGANAFGSTRMVYGLANLSADFKVTEKLTPYLTGGAGLARVSFNNHGVVLAAPTLGLPAGRVTAMNSADTTFAWQIGGGIGYEVTENVTIDLGYRYFRAENVALTGVLGDRTSVDLSQHKFNAGLRVSF